MNPASLLPSSLSPIANHLWQSTLFAGIAGLLALALRGNAARVRHGLWMAASLKFLIPLSLLISLGSHIEWRTVPAIAQSNVSIAMEKVSQPFTAPVLSPSPATPPPAASCWPAVLLGAWACGFIGIACSWWIRCRRIRSAVRDASPLHLGLPIEAMSSPTLLEPGVFGIFRPVLLVPEGIAEHLTPAQWKAVVAHELCHVRHRDNLTAGIQMFVETVFWFHPLLWWIGKRMVEERERACDEEVLVMTGEPRSYAEGILNVCKHYVESPVACVSGVTGGSNLKKRIEEIMKNRSSLRLNFWKKLLLAAAGILVASAPLIVGFARAQTNEGPRFEVASLKKVADGQLPPVLSIRPRWTPGRFSWGSSLSVMMSYAYSLPRWRISGIEKARSFYTIDATLGASATEDQVRLMLQALLVERLNIVSHRETKELPGYALVVAKNGPKLKTADGLGEEPAMPDYVRGKSSTALKGRILTTQEGKGTSAILGRGVTISQFAEELSAALGASVRDETGLTGRYYFGFKFQSMGSSLADSGDDAPQAASIFSVVQNELGLKLEKRKGPVEFLVLDRVEESPSEN